MNPSILVLANLSDTAERTVRYAAVLGGPLHVHLTLLHLYHNPLLAPDLVTVAMAQTYRSQAETAAALRAMAQRVPTPTAVRVSVDTLHDAVAEAVQRDHPLLLAMGLSAEHDLLDHLLHNQALPVLRATHRPLLLVPEGRSALALPYRVAIAADAEPFTPNTASRGLAPLLASWPADYTVVHVRAPHEQLARPGQMALADVRASSLLPAATALALHEEEHLTPAGGILHALETMEADLLVLIARPRSFLGRLFHRSVTAQVLRHCPIPVLLLPAEDPEMPDWMPKMS